MQKIESLESGKYYHIYNRGINGENLFKENRNHEYFLMLYTKHIDPIAETLAWCLLKNHFHLLVRIKTFEEILKSQKEFEIKKIIPAYQSFGNLFNAYTKAINKGYNRHGALFERSFKRKLIDNDNYLRSVIKYIHYNPVNHGFCDHPIEYPWSSYLTCVSEKQTKLKREKVILLFENINNLKSSHNERENFTSLEEFLNL
ncbi:transposase [Flavobacterium johnsoniae]|uniref:Transposase IS200 like n=1 Tax=Flavobacterium johnsoniae TaxID=986 RepID=A0A1M5M4H0_FLAJO|nr:transposase [Flavobacterium johnsoniae]SHG72126.1 Transposase IS200 like [Flavobacterium johnsoniae]